MTNNRYEFGDFDGRSPNFQAAMKNQASAGGVGASQNSQPLVTTWTAVNQSGGMANIPLGGKPNPHSRKIALICVLAIPVILLGGGTIISSLGEAGSKAEIARYKADCVRFWTGWDGRIEFAAKGFKMAAVQSEAMRQCPQATPRLNGPQPGR